MALAAGEIIEVSIRGNWLAQAWFNVWQYEVGVTLPGENAAQVAQAWWNHVKSTYRALAPNLADVYFSSVICKSLDSPTGDYAEYAIPPAEQNGTRAVGAGGDALPSFLGAGVRLAVGTRVTRPGQKRFNFLYEGDVVQQTLVGPYITLINAHMAVMSVTMVLGAPIATATLNPVVVRKGIDGMAVADQPVTGFALNTFVTSQVSRKRGRGI